MDAQRHRDKVALVTGTGSGIGQATALRLAQEGASVAGFCLHQQRADETLELIRKAGKDALMLAGDVTSQADVDRVVQATLAAYGRIDILVNNAGINDWFLPVDALDDETWRNVMGVNVDGVMMLCRAVVPGMRERKSGAIVNVSSVGGLGGGSSGFAYTTSKHAVIGMTRSIAWTYRAVNIRCNAVCPGGVVTNIGTTSIPRDEWAFEQLKPFHALAGHMAQPDEIASLISWLASDEASNVSGAVITADNGWTAA
jgi:NAD(P)-dependent dehydrogenase (short-subunit alcohol dehydrogenase family)